MLSIPIYDKLTLNQPVVKAATDKSHNDDDDKERNDRATEL